MKSPLFLHFFNFYENRPEAAYGHIGTSLREKPQKVSFQTRLLQEVIPVIAEDPSFFPAMPPGKEALPSDRPGARRHRVPPGHHSALPGRAVPL